MKDPAANARIPLGKLAWIVLAVVAAGPLLFFALVTPKEAEPAPTQPVVTPSRTALTSVGLRENRDWDGLPEIFALWSAKAHWRNNRTRFAYWHPGTQSRSYFFEVRRTKQGLRFREIPEPNDKGYEWDPNVAPGDPLCLYLPIARRPEDPVVPLDSKSPGGA